MNKGERRRNRRKYRVRYDRIVIMVLVAAVLIVLVSSCVLALTKKGTKPAVKNKTRSSQTSDSTAPTDAEGQTQDPTGEAPSEAAKPAEEAFVTESHEHDEIYKGNLVLVNADYEYKFIDGDIDPITLFDNRNEYYDNGDFVTKLDRVARSVQQGIELIDSLAEKGVTIKILNMGTLDNSPTGKLIRNVMLCFAEFERDMIMQRTREGKEIARQNPDYHEGPNRKYSDAQLKHALSLLGMNSYSEVERMTGISKSTLIRAKKYFGFVG